MSPQKCPLHLPIAGHREEWTNRLCQVSSGSPTSDQPLCQMILLDGCRNFIKPEHKNTVSLVSLNLYLLRLLCHKKKTINLINLYVSPLVFICAMCREESGKGLGNNKYFPLVYPLIPPPQDKEKATQSLVWSCQLRFLWAEGSPCWEALLPLVV